ncbi:porin family protein [Spirosoma foliorum]|uniref:PorT family protein n=1 Tax=Spirosoma foliorum TaxID=2710596 RepID=A0A7G5GQG8_9BACT|nr:porin family protein [Spirosoma foliorum]QMW01110.1 PorT family protein [Spirosoma foliorum]
MKLFSSILVLTFLAASSTMGQTGSGNTTASPNRQQELYDQYHGINKKTTTNNTAPTTMDRAKQREQAPTKTKPAVVTTLTQPTETASLNRSKKIADTNTPSGVRIGIRGGVTYPVFTETVAGVDPEIGFIGGLTFNFGSGNVSFQPEINYARYANKVTNFITYKNAIDYLEVPLFLKFSTGTYAGNRFFLNVGPYANYALSASQDGKKQSLDGAKGRFGFGAGAGVGAAIKAGPGHVTIEVRGLYSLGDTDNGFNTDSKTIFGQGTLGYIFPLGR